MNIYDQLFTLIEQLVLCHSPSGAEEQIDQLLLTQLNSLGRESWQDPTGNIIVRIRGRSADKAVAIATHKDEIGAIVKDIDSRGRVKVEKLGGSYPWVYGEGIVDLLGDVQTVSGVLCFGSRHVSSRALQHRQKHSQPVHWHDAWIETKCSLTELQLAGIRPGTRMVVGEHRKKPFRLKNHIASYGLDNKASLAVLLVLAETLKRPAYDTYLLATTREEVGASGILYFTRRHEVTDLIALDICPLAREYTIQDTDAPVIVVKDSHHIYDERLNQELVESAKEVELTPQLALVTSFASDASVASRQGQVARASCVGFATENTHGYEIASLEAIASCVRLLQSFCEGR